MKLETLFAPGDTAWLLFNNEPRKTIIKQVDVTVTLDKTITEQYTHEYPKDSIIFKSIEDLAKAIEEKGKSVEDIPAVRQDEKSV